MIRYVLTNDETLLRDATKQIRAFAWTRWLGGLLKLVCFLGLGGLLALAVYGRLWVISAAFGFFFFLLVLGPRLDYWVALRRLKRSDQFASKTEVTLSDTGIEMTSPFGSANLKWNFLRRVVRRKTGFILFFDQDPPRWWPDASLVEGRKESVEDMFRRNTPAYEVAD